MKKGQIAGPRKLLGEDPKPIARARVAAGLTQIQLAERLGTHQNQISAWEIRGVDSIRTLKRIADALQVDWKTLVE